MKEQIIQIPDTLEIKEIKDGKIILVEKKKKVTYEDVAKNLFDNKYTYYIQRLGIGEDLFSEGCSYNGNTFTSEKQAEKLLAINKLMNVAKYLNGDWKPDWSNKLEGKYYLVLVKDRVIVHDAITKHNNNICFMTEKLARRAIEILGEDTIRLAFCDDY